MKVRVIATLVGFALAIAMIMSLHQNNTLLEEQNDQGTEADNDRLQAQYERMVLGCNSAGALVSDDPMLRELCDVTLPEVRSDLEANT